MLAQVPSVQTIELSKGANGAVSLVNTTWPKLILIDNDLMTMCLQGKTSPYFTCNGHEVYFNVRNGYATYTHCLTIVGNYFELVSGAML